MLPFSTSLTESRSFTSSNNRSALRLDNVQVAQCLLRDGLLNVGGKVQIADDRGQRGPQLVGDRVDELATVLVELLELHDELLLVFVGPRAEQGPSQVVAETECGVAFALGPAVFTAVAHHDYHGHRLVPRAYWHEQQLPGAVRREMLAQGISVLTVQLVVAPHSTWFGNDHRPRGPRATRCGLHSGTQRGRECGGAPCRPPARRAPEHPYRERLGAEPDHQLWVDLG